MKLSFKALDERGTTFETYLRAPERETLLCAFEHWCMHSMPPEGEQWTRVQHEVRQKAGAVEADRMVVVFSDDGLARRFRSVWAQA